MRLIHGVCGLLVIAASYALFRQLMPRGWALAATVLVGLSHSLLMISRLVMLQTTCVPRAGDGVCAPPARAAPRQRRLDLLGRRRRGPQLLRLLPEPGHPPDLDRLPDRPPAACTRHGAEGNRRTPGSDRRARLRCRRLAGAHGQHGPAAERRGVPARSPAGLPGGARAPARLGVRGQRGRGLLDQREAGPLHLQLRRGGSRLDLLQPRARLRRPAHRRPALDRRRRDGGALLAAP